MNWIWESDEWFNFKYDTLVLGDLENQFLHQSGLLQGETKHIDKEEALNLMIDLACDEGLSSSAIEGEILNRDSLRSSIQKNLGLKFSQKTSPAEEGMSEMLTSLYQEFAAPLSDLLLCRWHEMVMRGRWDIPGIGAYRQHSEPMQIVSGYVGKAKVHYEAPPSAVVPIEMQRYIKWYNKTRPFSATSLPILTRAGIAHLYFECIHPFEDGNGRLGRAIAIKAISQGINRPTIIALSDILNQDKKNYYHALAKNNCSNEITEWLLYFGQSILKAQQYTLDIIDFVIAKKKFYAHFSDLLNQRQRRVIERLFLAGTKGFEGGLSAKNYMSIAKTSASTATRDLQELVKMGALSAEGELKSRRYFLNVSSG